MRTVTHWRYLSGASPAIVHVAILNCIHTQSTDRHRNSETATTMKTFPSASRCIRKAVYISRCTPSRCMSTGNFVRLKLTLILSRLSQNWGNLCDHPPPDACHVTDNDRRWYRTVEEERRGSFLSGRRFA